MRAIAQVLLLALLFCLAFVPNSAAAGTESPLTAIAFAPDGESVVAVSQAGIVESVEHQRVPMRARLAELDPLFALLQSRAFNGGL